MCCSAENCLLKEKVWSWSLYLTGRTSVLLRIRFHRWTPLGSGWEAPSGLSPSCPTPASWPGPPTPAPTRPGLLLVRCGFWRRRRASRVCRRARAQGWSANPPCIVSSTLRKPSVRKWILYLDDLLKDMLHAKNNFCLYSEAFVHKTLYDFLCSSSSGLETKHMWTRRSPQRQLGPRGHITPKTVVVLYEISLLEPALLINVS